MGSGIAEVAAKAGLRGRAALPQQESADAMVAGLEKSLAKQVERGKRTEEEATRDRRPRSAPPTHLGDLVDCDLVIESVVEDLAVKKALFAELDRSASPTPILATNTSTLPVVELAMATDRPDQVCGIHFFNPAPAMALVEIVRPITASDDTIGGGQGVRHGLRQGPRRGQGPGRLHRQRAALPVPQQRRAHARAGRRQRDDIDAAMKGGCNFPMGPLALLDLVGLDTSLAILDALYAEFRDPNYAAVPLLRRMVTAGQLGRKSGTGFYDYSR